jgi:hypothetical protein
MLLAGARIMCRRTVPFFTLALAALWAQPRSASACSPQPCATFITPLPADGTTDAPLNSELRVRYLGSGRDLDSQAVDLAAVRLVAADARGLELRATRLQGRDPGEWWMAARSEQLLAAGTEYELQVLMGPAKDACAETREWTTVSHFRTTHEVDDEAPEFGGIASLSYGTRRHSGGTCGGTDWIPITPSLMEVHDASALTHFNVYVDGEITQRFVPSLVYETVPLLSIDCSLVSDYRLIPPGSALEVRAVDLAGNESAPGAVFDVAQCGEHGAIYDQTGCSLSRGASMSWSSVLGLSSLVLLRARRKRIVAVAHRPDASAQGRTV